jgi:hypothetical protein
MSRRRKSKAEEAPANGLKTYMKLIEINPKNDLDAQIQ